MKISRSIVIFLLSSILILGCGSPEIVQNNSGEDSDHSDTSTQNDAPDEAPLSVNEKDGADNDFERLLTSNVLVVSGITANEDGETAGEILTMHLINKSDDTIEFDIPCGLVFSPEDDSEQPLMLVQPIEVGLEAGEEIDLQPYVVCVDLGTSAPALGSIYTVGYTAENQLLHFAQCICDQEISPDVGGMDVLGIQFAAWSISIDGDINSFLNEADESALAEALEEMSVDEMADYFSGIVDAYGQQWLDLCEIVPGEE